MRLASVLLIAASVATALAGCLGGDDENIDSAIPRAKVVVSDVAGKVDTYLFDASDSTGRGLKFEWDFGDGERATDEVAEHRYQYGSGVYTASLTITDLTGITDVWEEDIQVGDGSNLPPEAFFTPSTRYLLVGEPLTVDATKTTDPEGDPIRYEWDFNSIMTGEEYIAFREAKKDAKYEDSATVTVEEGSGDGTTRSAAGLPTLPGTTGILSGQKDAGHDHGNTAPPVSLFNGLRSTTDPVFTLQEGFPDPTTFYVRLVAFDVKGASQEILSEEVWPVQVVDVKKQAIYEGSMSGTFQLGSPPTIQESTPNDENLAQLFDDDLEWDVDIPDPIDTMWINVTWTQQPIEDVLANDIDLKVTTPDGKTREVAKADKSIELNLTRLDEVDTSGGLWTLELVARSGVLMDYTVGYWAKIDLNPFRALEAPYVEEDVPRDGET